MFSIPGKQAVSISEKAAVQIAKLMAAGGHQGLRIGVKKGGCAGMEYTMDYVAEQDPNDEVVRAGKHLERRFNETYLHLQKP